MKKTYCTLAFIALMTVPVISGAQDKVKIPLSHSVYNSWFSISAEVISHDGKMVVWEERPFKGDNRMILWSSASGKHDTISRGKRPLFSNDGSFLIYRIKPQEAVVRKAKLDKVKKDDMPKDSLAIWFFQKDTTIVFPKLKDYKMPEENNRYVAVWLEKEAKKAKKDTTASDTSKTKEKPVKNDKEKKPIVKKDAGNRLVLLNTSTLDTSSYPDVTSFEVSRLNGFLAFVQLNKDSLDSSKVYYFDYASGKAEIIAVFPGKVQQLSLALDGSQVAWLQSADTTENKSWKLYSWSLKERRIKLLADTSTGNLKKQWSPSENGKLWFSDDGKKLFFGTVFLQPNPPKDTLLDEEKVNLDLWSWNDPLMMPHQLKNLENEKKKSYHAIYYIVTGKVVQLADSSMDEIAPPFRGLGKFAIGYSTIGYEIELTWNLPARRDYFLVDLETGKRTLVGKASPSGMNLSPGGKYIYWYSPADSNWYSQSVSGDKPLCLTCNIPVLFCNELHDDPSEPDPYGKAGWLKGDKAFFVYDRFDLWKLDPAGKAAPVKMTDGRSTKTSHRVADLDPENQFLEDKLFIKLFNETTCREGYALMQTGIPLKLNTLINEDFAFNWPVKAKNANVIVWDKCSFAKYPDLWISSLDKFNPVQISDANPQMKDYLWGSVKKYFWTTPKGRKMEGLLYYPANFDPDQEYPMIVYFYERNSDMLNQHYAPKPSRSVINFSYYTSNGYLIFVPDIVYGTGTPGEDAYDCVISGVKELMKNSWVDKKHMGLQGQSWGGYQVAWLVTKTDNLFAAAMAGAPVANMTSAYGGIRWESGMSRMFQYEKAQSRLGCTLWECPEYYINNSPLFGVPEIKTPLLIMSNDGDGAVPWYQGIELYTAMRRLSKPCWLLNYNGDGHNLEKKPNTLDLTIRMQQFFDHYLKGAPAPAWMTEGIPAISKGLETGY